MIASGRGGGAAGVQGEGLRAAYANATLGWPRRCQTAGKVTAMDKRFQAVEDLIRQLETKAAATRTVSERTLQVTALQEPKTEPERSEGAREAARG